jgi:hypothetical protein
VGTKPGNKVGMNPGNKVGMNPGNKVGMKPGIKVRTKSRQQSEYRNPGYRWGRNPAPEGECSKPLATGCDQHGNLIQATHDKTS